jgi:hypothetical protein
MIDNDDIRFEYNTIIYYMNKGIDFETGPYSVHGRNVVHLRYYAPQAVD